jgi:hypothetical protein
VRLEDELTRREHVREPPVPVIVSRPLDDEEWPALLHGWSSSARDDGALRGLVTYRREYTAGFWHDVVAWALAERIQPV